MPRSPDDIRNELLVVRCRRNDPAAWDELVKTFNDRLFYFVRRLVNGEDQALVVMQETWVQVLRSLRHLQSADRLTTWLYTIARRMVMNHYRREFAELDLAGDPSADVVDDGNDPITDLENAEWIHFGLDRIGLAEREVLTLFFLEDFSIAQTADVLGVPEGTVKSRLARARAELRQVLQRERQARTGGRS
ncbi:ECF RNA polymerase sigma factor SigW [Caulifigura coniformis]|uniref:ECF RNA polymerase sigma factor SigW n=1 Tax=Caulifigura coniformis TaxID=2527983 RepID=A0A517SJM0_9PLAN|nr:sigma-70 family RNA polymerase sigma factor [Caulifigura coniformis]QDT56320.1 ECF RNA polymerase sigma factor SigW [Caulifigura coniformis]